MLCEHCPALTDGGTYEYPETNCLLRGDDECIEFKNGYGCRMRLETIKKRVEKYDKALDKYFEEMAQGITRYELERDECNRNKLLGVIDCMTHALGLNRAKTYMRNGVTFKKPYRNYFATARECDGFEFCRYAYEAGFMSCAKDPREADDDVMLYFHVTKDGIEWLERMQHYRINTTEIKEELK